jgi:eukaryotic translation initiation factor 2C
MLTHGKSHYLDDSAMGLLRKDLTMLVGIDVTHPGPGSVRGTPSIAAVVASVDGFYAQYPVSMEIQESKKEVPLFFAKLLGMPEHGPISRWSLISRR